jgi:hypothetical protein
MTGFMCVCVAVCAWYAAAADGWEHLHCGRSERHRCENKDRFRALLPETMEELAMHIVIVVLQSVVLGCHPLHALTYSNSLMATIHTSVSQLSRLAACCSLGSRNGCKSRN